MSKAHISTRLRKKRANRGIVSGQYGMLWGEQVGEAEGLRDTSASCRLQCLGNGNKCQDGAEASRLPRIGSLGKGWPGTGSRRLVTHAKSNEGLRSSKQEGSTHGLCVLLLFLLFFCLYFQFNNCH